MVSSLEGAKGKRSLESVSKPAPSSKRSRGLTDDNTWNQKFFELMLYRAKSGDIHIEPSDEEHKDLYEWIDQQRQEYKRFTKNKQNSLLNEDRVQVLKSVGFSFLVRNNKSWQHQYEQLKKFKKRYGHVLVQRNVEFKGLGDWVVAQRTQHGLMKEGQDSQMDSHRKALLDEIGFVWQVRNRPGWQARYDELVEFKSKHGHTKVPQSYSNNKPLGKWVAKQRMEYNFLNEGKKSLMTQDRLEKLNAIDFVWYAKERSEDFDLDYDRSCNESLV